MRSTRPRKSEGLGVGLLRPRGMELEHQLLGPEIEGTRCLEGRQGPDSGVMMEERLGFWTSTSCRGKGTWDPGF